MKKQGNNLVSILGHVLSVGDVLMDMSSNYTLRKQARSNTKIIVGASIAMSVVATGVSLWQTERIINAIRKEAMEGPNK